MKKPKMHKFRCTSKSDDFFTKGETYTAYRTYPKWTFIDDEGDNHGMSDHDVKRWFKEVA